MEGMSVYDIEVRSSVGGDMTVELWGEFDLTSASELRSTLDNVASLRKPTTVDLSGVTFLDLQSTRELAIRSQLYAHHLTLVNPSWQARASVKAYRLQEWVRFGYRVEQPLQKVS
jgi:anti-anti-sigma regulatory factor